MKNERWIICFDFETDLPDPETCNPVQLAAVPINPETLEIKKDQVFNVYIKPPGIDRPDYFEVPNREKTINWHAENYGISYGEVVDKWKAGVSQKVAWKNFCTYCSKYVVDKKPGQWYPEPIPAGYNIGGFDIPLAQRLAKKHKTKMPFSDVVKFDAYDAIFWWFESLDEPFDFKLDTLRKFLGLKLPEGTSHDALTDIFEEAALVTRFLKFHRKQARVDKFKGSFKGVEI